VNVFTCSSVVLPVKILLWFGAHPLNAITLDFSGEQIASCNLYTQGKECYSK